MKAEIETLGKDRAALAGVIDEGTLSRYERIFVHRQGFAVVAIANAMCTGCHLKLTTQTIHDAMREDALVTCTNCGRILFHQRGTS